MHRHAKLFLLFNIKQKTAWCQTKPNQDCLKPPAARNQLLLVKVGNGWHINNTKFGKREVYQQLFGPEARAAGEGPRFNKPGLYWYATVQNFVDWITDDDGNAYTEEQFTEELIMQLIVLAREEFLAAQAVARNTDLRRP